MKEISSERSYHRLCALVSRLVNVAAPTARSSAYNNGRPSWFQMQRVLHTSEWEWNLLTETGDGLKGFLASQSPPLKPPTPRTPPSMLISKTNPLTRNITSQQTELTMENFVTQYRNSPTDSTYHSLRIIFIWWLWRQFWKTNHAAISKDWVSFRALVGQRIWRGRIGQ